MMSSDLVLRSPSSTASVDFPRLHQRRPSHSDTSGYRMSISAAESSLWAIRMRWFQSEWPRQIDIYVYTSIYGVYKCLLLTIKLLPKLPSYVKVADLLDTVSAGAFTRLEYSRDSLSSYAEILYRVPPKSLDLDSSPFGWPLMDACKKVYSGRLLLGWPAKAT